MTIPNTPDPNYLLEGPEDAPVLVLSDPPGTSLEMWDDEASALGECFYSLRDGTRGHGTSPAPPGPYAVEGLGRDADRGRGAREDPQPILDQLEARWT